MADRVLEEGEDVGFAIKEDTRSLWYDSEYMLLRAPTPSSCIPNRCNRFVAGGLGGIVASLLLILLTLGASSGSSQDPQSGQSRHDIQLQQEGVDCTDAVPSVCAARAALGHCESDPEYMLQDCRASCNACPKASVFLPRTFTVALGRNLEPAAQTKCTTVETPYLGLWCPSFVTDGNRLGLDLTQSPSRQKFLITVTAGGSSETASVCASNVAFDMPGWDHDLTFECVSRLTLITIGVGPMLKPWKQCTTLPFPTMCPEFINHNNRVPRDGLPHRFRITMEGEQVCAERIDEVNSWLFSLAFYCQAGSIPSLQQTAPVLFGAGDYWSESCSVCTLTPLDVICPAMVSNANWALPDESLDVFSISSAAPGQVCATKVDSVEICDELNEIKKPMMWTVELKVNCAPACSSFDCPANFQLIENPSSTPGDTCAVCCVQAPKCCDFDCKDGLVRIENAGDVFGNSAAACCQEAETTTRTTITTTFVARCCDFDCKDGFVRIDNADEVVGDSDAKCCVKVHTAPRTVPSTTSLPSAPCEGDNATNKTSADALDQSRTRQA